jgi:hypothetical protein
LDKHRRTRAWGRGAKKQETRLTGAKEQEEEVSGIKCEEVKMSYDHVQDLCSHI